MASKHPFEKDKKELKVPPHRQRHYKIKKLVKVENGQAHYEVQITDHQVKGKKKVTVEIQVPLDVLPFPDKVVGKIEEQINLLENTERAELYVGGEGEY
jgi:hypothetical protein